MQCMLNRHIHLQHNDTQTHTDIVNGKHNEITDMMPQRIYKLASNKIHCARLTEMIINAVYCFAYFSRRTFTSVSQCNPLRQYTPEINSTRMAIQHQQKYAITHLMLLLCITQEQIDVERCYMLQGSTRCYFMNIQFYENDAENCIDCLTLKVKYFEYFQILDLLFLYQYCDQKISHNTIPRNASNSKQNHFS